MKKTWTIYIHKNKINGKIYIGQTCQDVEKRWKNGEGYKGANNKFYNAIKKYGWDNFEHKVLEDNIKTQTEANRLECYYIELYDSIANGYNTAEGGTKGNPFKGKTEKEMIVIKNKLKEANAGENHPNYGKHLNEKTKEKIKKSNTGKVVTEKSKDKMSESKKGKLNPNWGRFGDKHPMSKKVVCFPLCEVFDSTMDAERELNINHSNISRCCNGKVKLAGKLDWYYLDDLLDIFF